MLQISTCRKSRPSKGGGERHREKVGVVVEKVYVFTLCDSPNKNSIHKLWGSHRHSVKVCAPKQA